MAVVILLAGNLAYASPDYVYDGSMILAVFFGGVGVLLFGFLWTAKKRDLREAADKVAEELLEKKIALDKARRSNVDSNQHQISPLKTDKYTSSVCNAVTPLTAVNPTPPPPKTPSPGTAEVYSPSAASNPQDDIRAQQRRRFEERRGAADEVRRRHDDSPSTATDPDKGERDAK